MWREYISKHPFLFSATIATVVISISVTVCVVFGNIHDEFLIKKIVEDVLTGLILLWILIGIGYFISKS